MTISRIKNLVTLAAAAITALLPASALAALTIDQGASDAKPTSASSKDLFGNAGLFGTISDILIFLIGAISVIMIIIGAFRYVLSGGNKDSITGAKNTIMYAVIGIIVAILAYAIVHFVITSLK